jgi:ATP-dependent Lhr-like helicase
VDGIHAFVSDDRGWHLLSVLARIARLAEKPIQRVGLSATVGNPEVLLDWLVGAEPPESRVLFVPREPNTGDAEVKIDFVASIDNAAIVIARMHRGHKRLVFVDSRAGAEKLGHLLRQMETTTFVIHSSLSREQRHAAEVGFAERGNCVMVTTSALELGIDIGDLDHVVQINSPGTVSSFLQRMGRTGRRAGTRRNCLFLATNPNGLLCAAALEKLRLKGFVEPALAPPLPYHIFAQQLMALALQEGGIEPGQWQGWIGAVPAFDSRMRDEMSAIIQHMLDRNIIWEDAGRFFIGDEGARKFGRRHFMELLSVFTAAPLFLVRHGRDEIGYVEELLLLGRVHEERLILLSGNSWRVTHIDWQRRVAHVEPAAARGRAQWIGAGEGLSFHVCQAIRNILVERDAPARYSRRVPRCSTRTRVARR